MNQRTLEEIVLAAGEAQKARNAEQLRVLAQEADTLGTPDAQAYALNLTALAHTHVGEFAESVPLFRQAIERYRELSDPQMLISNLGNLGISLRMRGDLQDALVLHQEEAALAREHDLQGALARALGHIATVYKDLGEYPEALEGYHRALGLATQLNLLPGMAANTGNLGLVHYHLGDHPRALECYYKAIELYTQLESLNEVAGLSGNVGNVFNKLRDFDEAVRWYAKALDIHERIGNRYGMGLQHQNLSSMHFERGTVRDGLEHLAKARAIYEDIGYLRGVRMVIASQALHEIYEGNTGAARALLNSMPDQGPSLEDAVMHKRINGKLLMAEGDLEGAAALLTEALDAADRTQQQLEVGLLTHDLRELAYARKDIDAYVHYNTRWVEYQVRTQGSDVHRQLMAHEVERRSMEHRQELERHKAVLYSTLPREVAERVLHGETVNDLHADAAVLFADIVGFTSHTSGMDPNDVVALLGRLFSAFDQICADHGVVKVKTIGDCYLCFKSGGTATENAAAIAAVAHAMQRAEFTWSSEIDRDREDTLALRIGIHQGPIIAGIVGEQRLQYDIWGDTVNTASRMESTGEPGRIQVSESFAAQLLLLRSVAEKKGTANSNSQQQLRERGAIDVKGKGTMTTYWLEE